MTREELLKSAKPILFNTNMVRAILDGRKTQTRRVIKIRYVNTHIEICDGRYGKYVVEKQNDVDGITRGTYSDGRKWEKLLYAKKKKPLYDVDDILYVRETWAELKSKKSSRYVYKATDDYPFGEKGYIVKFKWKPSIHMPKEAARIFLRVMDVRVEQLQDITNADAIKEGFVGEKCDCSNAYLADGTLCCTDCMNTGYIEPPVVGFIYGWDTTQPKKDLDKYGWKANPWVWVYEFERIDENGSKISQ